MGGGGGGCGRRRHWTFTSKGIDFKKFRHDLIISNWLFSYWLLLTHLIDDYFSSHYKAICNVVN